MSAAVTAALPVTKVAIVSPDTTAIRSSVTRSRPWIVHTLPPSATAVTAPRASGSFRRSGNPRRAGSASLPASATSGPMPGVSIAATSASPFGKRASGFFESSLSMMKRRPGGQSAVDRSIGVGLSCAIWMARVARLVPAKATRPVTISYRTTPSENRSARPSTGRPSACSGLM